MPWGPKGEKRPADVIGNAVKIIRIASGEEEDDKLVQDKFARLLELRHQTLADAADELGVVPGIRAAFVGFQEHLFSRDAPEGSSHP